MRRGESGTSRTNRFMRLPHLGRMGGGEINAQDLHEPAARLARAVDEEEGQGLTEYALILALIAVIAIAALTLLGGKVRRAQHGGQQRLVAVPGVRDALRSGRPHEASRRSSLGLTVRRTAGITDYLGPEQKENMLSIYTKLQIALARAFDEEEGKGLTEYALILALIAVIAIAALTLLGGKVSDVLSTAANSI